VPIALVTFRFDPSADLFGDLVLRWGTIGLVVAIVAALVLAGVLVRAAGLHAEDVPYVAIGIVPGAVVGGRLGYAIGHPAAFGSPAALFDPAVGGLELGLAVVGGFITGVYVASLLGSPVGRWLHVAMAPALFVLGTGKLTMVLTGAGQGIRSDAIWSTRYLGPGPWGSLVPALPSMPSQAAEGIATLAILAVLTVFLMVGMFRRRDGTVFFLGIGLWAVARAAVSTTWRDSAVIGALPAGGVIALAIAIACAAAVLLLLARSRRVGLNDDQDVPVAVAWPDPEADRRV